MERKEEQKKKIKSKPLDTFTKAVFGLRIWCEKKRIKNLKAALEN